MAVNVRHYCLFLTYNDLIFSRTDVTVSNVGSPAVPYQGLFLMETGRTCTKIRLHSLLVEWWCHWSQHFPVLFAFLKLSEWALNIQYRQMHDEAIKRSFIERKAVHWLFQDKGNIYLWDADMFKLTENTKYLSWVAKDLTFFVWNSYESWPLFVRTNDTTNHYFSLTEQWSCTFCCCPTAPLERKNLCL